MKALRLTLLACLSLVFASAAWAKPIKLARTPDYHGGRIIFSYLDDIWMVNEDGSNPRRLTVHTARDVNPRFSPDGKWIAFSSNRFGNMDVFVMSAEGGEPKQLTFHSGNDTVVGWSRDGKRVIFSAGRGHNYTGTPGLYEVSVEGGLEQLLPLDWGTNGTYSPDGKKFAFNRHPMTWWRKHYRGSYAADLWVLDVEKKTFARLVDDTLADEQRPNNFWPMYGRGEIFFVSDRDVMGKAGTDQVMKSTNNIWKVPEAGGRPVQVTKHTSGSLFHPSISADGKVIVYEENAGVWKLDVASGRTSEVKIDINSDEKDNNFEVLRIDNEADSYDLSPSTRRAVISAHGEIFTIATDRGDVTRVTSSYSRETDPQWSPDGKWIAFVSDQSGRDEVWVADPDGKNAKKISDSDTEKGAIAWAPDSKWLVYSASDRKLHLYSFESGQTRVLASNDVNTPGSPQFSPDGKWVSYTKNDPNNRPHVFIVPSAGGQERRIGEDDEFSSTQARWTPDGRRLIFLGGSLQGGSIAVVQNTAALYSVSLAKEDRDPMSRDVDSEEEALAAERADAPARGPRADQRPVEVKIDWEGLNRRIRQVTRTSDNITTAIPSPDSRSYAFVAAGQEGGRNVQSIYVIQANGQQMRRVAQSRPPGEDDDGPGFGGFGGGISSLQFSRDGRTLYFREGSGIWSTGVGGGAAPGAEARGGESRRRVSFTVRVEVDGREERRQVFNEAWRVMKHRFYDPKMHGVDWNRMRALYEPLLSDVGSREDLQSLVLQMIGELNASHTGISGGGGGGGGRNAIQTRYPGFEIEADASGYYKVTHVYKGGPADQDYVKVAVGNYVLAVNGQAIKAGDNYWKHYNLSPGRKMEFTVNSKPAADGSWTTKVEPISGGAHGTLQYQKWVEERRAIVDKLSNGEIGYLHIRSMNQPSLRQFERDLATYKFKKALIIDQRFNPGGNIDQELLQILQQRQYQYTRGRDSVYVTRPQRGYFAPIVVMQNERSTSDAEVFPDGVRTLKLGKVVGVTTYGAVIGTGSYRLMDGSQIRTPGNGLWNVDGINLENYGVPPDVYVDNTPADFLKGRDAQIEKAVEVLKEELRKNPPPKTPGR